jgi:hypothetical protein
LAWRLERLRFARMDITATRRMLARRMATMDLTISQAAYLSELARGIAADIMAADFMGVRDMATTAAGMDIGRAMRMVGMAMLVADTRAAMNTAEMAATTAVVDITAVVDMPKVMEADTGNSEVQS